MPVIFTGLADGAVDSTTPDDLDKQEVMSTHNLPECHFSLSSEEEKEEEIPCSQPRYHLSNMWWCISLTFVCHSFT